MLPLGNGGDSRKPQQGKSLDKVTQYLNDILGIGNELSEQIKLEHHVAAAIATLDDLKQEVVNRRFGLAGQAVQGYEEIAVSLNASLTSQLRGQIARERNITIEEVSISPQDVQKIEVEALRKLREPKRSN